VTGAQAIPERLEFLICRPFRRLLPLVRVDGSFVNLLRQEVGSSIHAARLPRRWKISALQESRRRAAHARVAQASRLERYGVSQKKKKKKKKKKIKKKKNYK
jgi:hypothetical protein